MRPLLVPLRRRPIWIAFVATVVLGFVGVVFDSLKDGDPAEAAANILLSFGVAFFIAAFVTFITNQIPDYRVQVLRGLSRPHRRQIRRGVLRGQADSLPEDDRQLAHEFADAYVTSTPTSVASAFLILTGFLFQAAARLAQWNGEWSSWALLAELVIVSLVLIAAVPLQIRWFENAEAYFEPNAASDQAATKGIR